MALISCPECGREISDKVNACPHCGYPLVDEKLSNDIVPEQAEPLPSMEYPITPKKRNWLVIGGASVVIAVVVIILSVFQLQRHNAASARAEYIDNLVLIRVKMLSGGATAEGQCNLTKSVWYNTIYEKSDSKTDSYTKNPYSGKFYDDFNDALSRLYSDSGTKATIAEIKANQESVADIMRALQNPPDGLESCYNTVESMYDAYYGLTGLAISPTGSLNTYSEDFRAFDSDFMKYYEKLDAQIPEQ